MNDLKNKHIQALRIIRNYLIHHGRSPTIREITRDLGYNSPRSGLLVLNELIDLGLVTRRSSGELQIHAPESAPDAGLNVQTVEVPLVGTASCGLPLLAEENIECTIPISLALARPGSRYFFLRATGDSMTEAGIEDGDLVLVRQQPTAQPGQAVIALIDHEATIKEFHIAPGVIILRPRTQNPIHKPIVVEDDLTIQGVVVKVIKGEHAF